jgi:hypothetical protein
MARLKLNQNGEKSTNKRASPPDLTSIGSPKNPMRKETSEHAKRKRRAGVSL